MASLTDALAKKLQSKPVSAISLDLKILQRAVNTRSVAEIKSDAEIIAKGVDWNLKLLKDAAPGKRVEAAIRLSGLRDPRVADAMLAMLTDPDGGVRSSAVFVLDEKRDPRAVDKLS